MLVQKRNLEDQISSIVMNSSKCIGSIVNVCRHPDCQAVCIFDPDAEIFDGEWKMFRGDEVVVGGDMAYCDVCSGMWCDAHMGELSVEYPEKNKKVTTCQQCQGPLKKRLKNNDQLI